MSADLTAHASGTAPTMDAAAVLFAANDAPVAVGESIAGYYSADKKAVRQTVNRWIREANAFDAIIDFDALIRGPAQPTRFLPARDSGDHLHPGDEAMAGAAAALLIMRNERGARRNE